MQNQLKYILLFCGIISGLNTFSQGETCATAIPAVIGVNTTNGPTAGVGAENICGFDNPANNAVWYQWTAPSNVSVTVASCLGGTDTRLTITTGVCGAQTCVVSNDDFCDLEPGGDPWASLATFVATSGATYFIQWDDRWSTTGFDWTISIANLDCPVLGLNIGDICDAVGAGDGIVNDDCLCVEFPGCPILVSPADGSIDVPLTGDNLDAVTLTWTNSNAVNGIYMGTDPATLVLTGSASSNITSIPRSGLVAGITYYWSVVPSTEMGEVTGCPVFSFTVEGDVDCPLLGLNGLNFGFPCDDGDPNTMNDLVSDDACVCAGVSTPLNAYCSTATSIVQGTFLDNRIADGGGGFGNCFADGLGTNTIWFEYTAPCGGNLTISSSIDLDNPNTRLSVYTGGCFTPICIASDVNGGEGNTSLITFTVISGTSYLIAWDDRYSIAEFDFEVSMLCNGVDSDFDGTPDVYDNCVNISNPFQIDHDMDGLGDLCDDDDDNDGDLDAVDCDILDNTIYFGAPCDDLDEATGNDVIQANCSCLGLQISENPTCNSAIIIGEGIVTGAIINGGGGAVNNCFDFGGTGAIWYSYTASADGDVTVNSTIDADEPDTRISIYTGLCDDLTCVAFNDDFDEQVFTSIVTFPASAGTTYLIEWDDRWSNTEFDFEVSLEPTAIPCPTDLNFDGVTNGDDFSIFLGNFGLICFNCSTDFVPNDETDGDDFSYFLGNFGLDCP